MEHQNIINLIGNISETVPKCNTKNGWKLMINQTMQMIGINK